MMGVREGATGGVPFPILPRRTGPDEFGQSSVSTETIASRSGGDYDGLVLRRKGNRPVGLRTIAEMPAGAICMNITPPPIQEPAPSGPVAPIEWPQIVSTAVKRRFQPSNSWLDVFDWKFEKYLTPWIVRLTWVLALVLAAISIILTARAVFVGSVSDLLPKQRASPPPRIEQKWEFQVPEKVSEPPMVFYRVLGFVLGVVVTIVGLLWLRVILETVIVLFNIARSLASIDRKTAGNSKA